MYECIWIGVDEAGEHAPSVLRNIPATRETTLEVAGLAGECRDSGDKAFVADEEDDAIVVHG